jgi:putative transcriptional regulator
MKNIVRDLRSNQDWSQTELASRLSVSRQTVHAIETGKYDPSLPLAFQIAKLFGKSIEYIFLHDHISTLDLQIDPLKKAP